MTDHQISQEVALFRKQIPLYQSIKDELDQFAEKLDDEGVEHKWKSRVKSPESLEKKLCKRHAERENSDIINIADLVAGRIVLWKYRDFPKIDALLREYFYLEQDSIQHPTSEEHMLTREERFRGYDGHHFRARLKSEDQKKSNVIIEIQVVHVVMSIFHDFEHGLGYKGNSQLSMELKGALQHLKGAANLTADALEHMEEVLANEHEDPSRPGYSSTGQSFLKRLKLNPEGKPARNDTYLSPEQQEKVVGSLLSVVADVIKSHNKSKPIPSSTIPFARDDKFVGREDILTRIQSMTGNSAPQKHNRVALIGLGGVGKSQIAIEYAYRLTEKSPDTWVFWVYSSDSARFEESFRDIALKVDLPQRDDLETDILHLVFHWLCDEKNGRWLIILDNADDDNIFFMQKTLEPNRASDTVPQAKSLARYLPETTNGTIIVTSRNSQAATRLVNPESHIVIEPMNKVEALTLLQTKISSHKSADADAERLVEVLERIPLAITQAAAYINMQPLLVTLSKYLVLFYETEDNQVRLLENAKAGDRRRDHLAENAIIVTWIISFEQIQTTTPAAADLLSFMSVLDRQGIPEYLLFDSPGSLDSIDALTPLINFSLISKQLDGDFFEMHRLVQLAIKNWLKSHKELAKWESAALKRLAQVYPLEEHGNRLKCRELLPHSRAALSFTVNEKGDVLNQARLRYNTAFHLKCGGKYTDAEQMYCRTLKEFEKALGEWHPNTLATIDGLSNLYCEQGKLAKAEEMYQRALKGTEETLGLDHTSTLDTVNNLGNLYFDQGKLAQAEEMYQRALEGYEKALGLDHTSPLKTVNNLGNLYRDQGKLAQAEEMYQRALKGREEALGLDHTSTLDTVNNLGNLYRDQGKLAQAEEMYQRALKGREEALGLDHTSTLDTVNDLGNLYFDRGKLAQAEEMYQRALKGTEETLGLDHTSPLKTVNNLGNLYRDQGKLAQAEEMYQRALKGIEEALGLDHTSTLKTVNNLGNLYRDQGKLAQAEEMYQRALKGTEETLGLDHTSTLDTVNNLGNLYFDQGKLAQAEEMYQRALEGYEKALGAKASTRPKLNVVKNLGNLYLNQGKLVDAMTMYQRALNGYEEILGHDNSTCLDLKEVIQSLNTL